MKLLVRSFVTGIVFLAAYFFASWFPFSFLLPHGNNEIRFIGCLLCALLVAFVVWARTDSMSEGMAGSIILGAVIIGAAGFSAGFFGPMIFTPGANQGPLLGIFITGPLGCIVGAVAGAIYWQVRGKRTAARANGHSVTSEPR